MPSDVPRPEPRSAGNYRCRVRLERDNYFAVTRNCALEKEGRPVDFGTALDQHVGSTERSATTGGAAFCLWFASSRRRLRELVWFRFRQAREPITLIFIGYDRARAHLAGNQASGRDLLINRAPANVITLADFRDRK